MQRIPDSEVGKKKTLEFAEFIRAPRDVVWDAMLGADTYRDWTSAFCDGSCYEVSWDQGGKIRFLSPGGNGMSAVVAECRRHEFISIRHLARSRPAPRTSRASACAPWAPAHENYAFADAPGGTALRVSVEVTPEFEPYMRDTYPRALRRLKAICEHGETGAAT